MSEWISTLIEQISFFNILLVSMVAMTIVSLVQIKRQNTMLKSDIDELQNQFKAMNSGHLGMGRAISRVSKEIQQVESFREEPILDAASEKTYVQAGLLLSRGVTIEEVVESCEISHAEAELLAALRSSSPLKPKTSAAA